MSADRENTSWGYSDEVKDHFFNPRNVMTEDEASYKADGVGEVGSPACGDMMKMWIKVDPAQDKIIDCKWKTYGCASAIGSTSMLSLMITENGGMSIDRALKLVPKDILIRLGGLPDKKIHCSVLGDQALRAAVYDYFRKSGQERRIPVDLSAETVCHCKGITVGDLRHAVEEYAIRDFEVLRDKTGVSTVCGKCEGRARELLEKFKKELF